MVLLQNQKLVQIVQQPSHVSDRPPKQRRRVMLRTTKQINLAVIRVRATPGVVDVLPSDPDVDHAATPEANMPGQSPKTMTSGDPRTVVPAVLTMMLSSDS